MYRPSLVLLLSTLLLSGCAATVPEVISHAPAVPVSARQASEAPTTHLGKTVRWGGDIVAVDNRRDATWVEVLSRPLDGDYQPDPQQPAGTRFLARMEGFIDPAEFAAGRLLTVVGRLDGSREQAIGEYPYRYPIVEVRVHHLWPVQREARHPPYWYDPWHGPWLDPWYRPWPYPRHW
jgi:outer membrane lipoprotein